MKKPEAPKPVAILDAGAQYVDLIQKACLRLGYAAEIIPLATPFRQIESKYSCFIVSGGPASTHANGAPMPDPALWATKKGVFGICYGQQAMALALGGTVEPGQRRQDGSIATNVDTSHPLFGRVKKEITALFTHGDFVTKAPPGFSVIGSHTIGDAPQQTVLSALARDNLVAVQFHPEVFDETPYGFDIFRGFFEDICGLAPDKSLLARHAATQCRDRQKRIAKQAGQRHVIAFASGGIDSTVATILASKAMKPSKLHAFYFDNGFMRDEDDSVIAMLQKLGVQVKAIDASKAFEQATVTVDGNVLGPLITVADPQIKRKIIGKKFAELKDEVAASLGLGAEEVMLLQGTNAADRIESGHSRGDTKTEQIKEHHNQVKEIKELEAAGLLIEPLDDLHKDEVRSLGEYLGLPDDVVWRQPFPGPGNAIRILCLQANEYEEPNHKIEKKLQAYVVATSKKLTARLLPTRSVGVGGDARSYVLPGALQGKATWADLSVLAREIPGNFRGTINRVVYALGEAPLSKLSLTETSLGKRERQQLRQADRIVFEEMRRHKLLKTISQCPVILLPLSFGKKGERSIVLRPIITSTYLTAKAVIPGKDVPEDFIQVTAERILGEVEGISQVFLELTNKPPATTEWE